jgi:hypothetical protein
MRAPPLVRQTFFVSRHAQVHSVAGDLLMRVAFSADEGGFTADEYSLACGVAGGGHYLTFQRDADESNEDWGIHLEFDDQSNGEYECVAACRIGSEMLSVDLSGPMGRLIGVTGFDVTLRLDPDRLSEVREGLRRIFRDQTHLLIET